MISKDAYEQRQPAGGFAGLRTSLSRCGAGSEMPLAVPAIVERSAGDAAAPADRTASDPGWNARVDPVCAVSGQWAAGRSRSAVGNGAGARPPHRDSATAYRGAGTPDLPAATATRRNAGTRVRASNHLVCAGGSVAVQDRG